MVFGEITSKANVDYEQIAPKTCREIGCISDDVGLGVYHCKVLVNVEQQSLDIAQAIHGNLTKGLRRLEPVTRVTCLAMQLMRHLK